MVKENKPTNLFGQLNYLTKKSTFKCFELDIAMVSGTVYRSTQYVNELAEKPSLLKGFQRQGFIKVSHQAEINPQQIESIEILQAIDSDFMPSKGFDVLTEKGYTTDMLVLSVETYQEIKNVVKNNTLFDDDDF